MGGPFRTVVWVPAGSWLRRRDHSLFTTLKGRSKRVWIVDADLSAAFDRVITPGYSTRSDRSRPGT